MPRPRTTSEDPRTAAATAAVVYDEAILTGLRLSRGRLVATFSRTDSNGNPDPEDDGLDIVFKDLDSALTRATSAETAWDNMSRALAAMHRERRLMEKIQRRTELGLGTAALEARLASVRTLLGIT